MYAHLFVRQKKIRMEIYLLSKIKNSVCKYICTTQTKKYVCVSMPFPVASDPAPLDVPRAKIVYTNPYETLGERLKRSAVSLFPLVLLLCYSR